MQITLRNLNMEGVVHEGWLVKSPPEKRLLKAKWRQRWFVLRHSGLLPGQYILEYFTDSSCRKLKGKIDLDHCDQVDVGSTCETKKTTYQFMFDIITPKRTYYLVAETEAEMNKWVDCICTVGGLKLYVDEDYLTPQESSIASGITSSPSVSTNLIEMKSSSNPYIPISECHTGKPVLNGDLPNASKFSDLPKEAPPPPPSIQNDQGFNEHAVSTEFYDYPRPIKPVTSNSVGSTKFGTVHKASNLSSSPGDSSFNGCKTLPPRVNWNTHPSDITSKSSAPLTHRNSSDKADAGAYDIVPPLHSSHRIGSFRHEVQDLACEFEKVSVDASQEAAVPSVFKAPPRPPKPSKLRERHEYENFEPIHLAGKSDDSAPYDIPPPIKGVSANVLSLNQTLSDREKESVNEASASTKVSLSSSVGNEALVDDTYDFPKFRSEDNINATVPPPYATGSTQRPRRHAYTNAPPGLFNSKELIFNYEYRPSLMSDYVNMDTNKQDLGASGDSPGPFNASAVGPYVNIPNTSPSVASGGSSDTPPAVNRGLKPKRRIEKGSFSFLTLQPPPLYKMRANKCSFLRHGEKFVASGAASPTVMSGLNGTPPVPNRFRHHAEISGTSEDDLSSNFSGSRRGSTNDDPTRFYFAGGNSKKDEIQYLDLDLDSEPSPSPKSPERVSATVYKKVDFVKTKAFNEMRQNVEETYRKSQ